MPSLGDQLCRVLLCHDIFSFLFPLGEAWVPPEPLIFHISGWQQKSASVADRTIYNFLDYLM